MYPASSSSWNRSARSISLVRRWLATQHPPSTPQLVNLADRSVLEVAGPDAQKFLKGLTSRDVETLQGGYSGFLNASGRVLHTVFILPAKATPIPTYFIIHEKAPHHPAPLLDFLPPFKLRSKVRVRDVSSEWDVWNAFGGCQAEAVAHRAFKLGSSGAAEAQWIWPDGVAPVNLGPNELGCWDLRAGYGDSSMGRKLLVAKGKTPSLASSHDHANLDDYDFRRMLLGVPEGSSEIIPGSALPLESCMDIHGGIDFRKGCYLGQELTVRTYHTGATRKRILPIRLDDAVRSESLPTGGEIIYHPPPSAASRKARSAGKILALHNGTSIGLALIRLEMAERSNWTTEHDRGKLTVDIDGKSVEVFVGQGEAYGALRALQYDA